MADPIIPIAVRQSAHEAAQQNNPVCPPEFQHCEGTWMLEYRAAAFELSAAHDQ